MIIFRRRARQSQPTEAKSSIDEDKYNKLISDIDFTAKIRFNSARRCEELGGISNWTITIISLLLIGMPVLQNLKVSPFSSDNPAQNAATIILAAFILVFSQISNLENYSLRAHRYHECAVKLNKLKRKAKAYSNKNDNDSNYAEICEKYDDIIRDHENHIEIDYHLAKWQNIQRRLEAMKANERKETGYEKLLGFYSQHLKVIQLRLILTSRFWLSLGFSFIFIIWSVLY